MTTTISGVWSAVLLNGQTVYQSGASVIDGPVSLGGNSPLLYVTSGAVVTGLTSPMSAYTALWGSAIVESGGTIQNSTLQTVVTFINSGGVLQDNTLNHTGEKASAGGIIRDNVKYNGGDLSAGQGAQVNDLSISQGSSLLSGAVWSGGTVLSGGIVSATSNSLVSKALVSSGGQIQILSGSTAQGVLTSGTGLGNAVNGIQGSLILSAGGTSFDAVIQGGYMAVQGTGALSQRAYVTSNGWQDVGSNNNGATGGGTASSTTLINGGAQFVKGGTAIDTYVSSGGLQEVSAGGQASGGTVFSFGALQVYAGGTGINNVVLADGQANIWGVAQASNGLASGLTIQNGGSAVSLSGGRLTALSFLSGGQAIVSSGGSIDQSVLSAGGQVRIQSGGTASQLTAYGTGWWNYTAGAVLVGPGGTALNTVLSGAYQAVQGQGAYTENTLVTNSGWQDVGLNSYDKLYGGGIASGSVLVSAGKQFVSNGGTALTTMISAGGTQTVMSRGVTSGTIVASGGTMAVIAGGTAFNANAVSGAVATVSQGGTAVASGGVASGVVILSGGSALGLSNGRMTGFTVQGGGEAVVSAGGTMDTSVLSAGGQARIQSGGTASQLTAIGNGWWGAGSGAVLVGAGGTALGTILSGGYQAVQGQGAYTENTLVTNSGWQDVGLNSYDKLYGGGIASASILKSGGKQFVSSGTAVATIISSGGTQTAMNGGVVSGSTVDSAGFMTVLAGGTGYNANALSGGRVLVAGGGTLSGGIIASGATLSGSAGALWGGNFKIGGSVSGGSIVSQGVAEISSGGTARDLFIASGGSLQIDAGGTLTGLANLAAGASATLDTDAGGTVNLGGKGFSRLTLTGTTNPSSVISGFNGTSPGSSDQIVLRDVPKSDILGVTYTDANHVKFLLTGNRSIVLNIPGVKSFGFDLSEGSGNSTVFSVCFLSGTMIRTPDGERAIETLSAGDAVHVYHRGCVETQNVIWVGYRSITEEDSASYDITDYPVRIEAEAFGGGMPYKDLLVTPEHCVFIAGNLVPVRMLVNGRSIRHDTSLKTYSYCHIETDCHSVVMADGLLCESYLDSGNRHDLAARSWVDAPLPVASGASGKHRMAAPLCVSRAFVEPIWKGLARRAGQVCDTRDIRHIDPMFHLSTEEGHIIGPLRVVGDRYIFQIPGHYGAVYLCSRAARPSDVVGPYIDDRRQLGVLIGAVTLYDPSSTQEIDVRDFLHAARGWHAAENGQLRWTSGRAFLPLDTLKDAGMRILAVQIVAGGPYHSATH